MTVDTNSKKFLIDFARHKVISYAMFKWFNVHTFSINRLSENKYTISHGNKSKKTQKEYVMTFYRGSYNIRAFNTI